MNKEKFTSDSSEKVTNIDGTVDFLTQHGYTVEEVNADKPWGGYVRLSNDDAEAFINQYFEGLSYEEACLGREDVELSPKILLVSPHERLSWQYHDRRAERWRFLTDGGYYKSDTDDMGELHEAHAGEVVQFGQGERHRLTAPGDSQTIVAEIWQHTDADSPSNEDDITRLEDDYKR